MGNPERQGASLKKSARSRWLRPERSMLFFPLAILYWEMVFRTGVYHALPQLGLQGVLTLLFSLALGGLLCLATTLCSPRTNRILSLFATAFLTFFYLLVMLYRWQYDAFPDLGKGRWLIQTFAQPRQLGGAVMDCIFPMIALFLPMLILSFADLFSLDFTPPSWPGRAGILAWTLLFHAGGLVLLSLLGSDALRAVYQSGCPAGQPLGEEAVSAFGLLTALRLQLKDLWGFPWSVTLPRI